MTVWTVKEWDGARTSASLRGRVLKNGLIEQDCIVKKGFR